MHELTLASSVLEIAEKKPCEVGADKIIAIELEIGQLTCVEPLAIEFAMEAILPDSAARGASVDYHFTAGRARCEDCSEEFELDFAYDPCPACTGFHREILAGEDHPAGGNPAAPGRHQRRRGNRG